MFDPRSPDDEFDILVFFSVKFLGSDVLLFNMNAQWISEEFDLIYWYKLALWHPWFILLSEKGTRLVSVFKGTKYTLQQDNSELWVKTHYERSGKVITFHYITNFHSHNNMFYKILHFKLLHFYWHLSLFKTQL